MSISESISRETANNSTKHEMKEKKSEASKEMSDMEMGIEPSRNLTMENLRKQTTDCCQTKIRRTESQWEENKVFFENLKTLLKKYKRCEKKYDPSSKLKENQHGRKTALKSPQVRRKGEAGKPLAKIAAKAKTDHTTTKIMKGMPNLCIDLSFEDVEEYFPQVVKVNLGHRCDSSAFHLQEIDKGVPSTDNCRIQKVIDNLEGIEAEGNTSTIKKSEISHKPAVPQLSSSVRRPVYKSSSNFKMIRFDYKKDPGKKSLVEFKSSL